MITLDEKFRALETENGPDLNRLETAFKGGTKVFVFSTPNNPTGLVYSGSSIAAMSELLYGLIYGS